MTSRKKISMTALIAILAAAGYGGYTVVKQSELAGMRSGQATLYTVARVIDGDTIELKDGDVVRLTGIDAPDVGECYFQESKDALSQLLTGKDVELRKDVTDTDDFGRLLRYAILLDVSGTKDSILASEYMVAGGYATPRSNPRDRLYYGMLLEKREEAMKAGRGLWSACDYAPGEHGQADMGPAKAECDIKGNISTGEFGKTYFLTGCNNYAQVKVDTARGEKYFCSEAEAVKAGFVKARYCP